MDSVLLRNNPAWQQSIQAISIAEAEKRLSRAERLPDFSIGYFIQSIAGNQEVDGQVINYNNVPRFQGFQVGINLPIFSGSAYNSKALAAQYQQDMRKTESDYYFQQIQSRLRQLTKNYLFYKDHLEYYKNTAIPNTASILKNSTRAYQSGDIGYVEYMYAIQTSLDTRKSYLEAINELNQTVISIQYLINQ
jgi:cobalt-zinc-cadmium resistance protein CzcA